MDAKKLKEEVEKLSETGFRGWQFIIKGHHEESLLKRKVVSANALPVKAKDINNAEEINITVVWDVDKNQGEFSYEEVLFYCFSFCTVSRLLYEP